MAFWSKKETELEATYHTIEQQLPSLAEAGLLLYEDERGGLWPFGRKSK